MSNYRQDSGDGQLPLPTPRSPRELDDRILAHARAKVPRKQPIHTAGWLGGLATTAVLVVAIYLANITETNRGLDAPAAPAAMKEERAAAGAAAPMASEPRARLKARADYDMQQSSAAEQEQRLMAPVAEATLDSAEIQAMKRADRAAPNLQGSLEHLRELVSTGDIERARREYDELRNACGECGLPEALETALEMLD